MEKDLLKNLKWTLLDRIGTINILPHQNPYIFQTGKPKNQTQ